MIREEMRGHLRVLRLDRPEKRNALDRATVEALLGAFARAAEEDCAALVLAAEGAAFCAGADLAEMKALAADPVAREARAALTVALMEAPGRVPKPVVAAVHGAAMGAGASLALACDAVVLAEDARLGWPEARHGMLPRLVAPVLLRHLGPKPAFDLLATGRALDAAQALSLGLATRVVREDVLLNEACALAEAAAGLPPAAMGALKRMIREGA
jgi:enoyl-CoA hydratase/carnithine racemase